MSFWKLSASKSALIPEQLVQIEAQKNAVLANGGAIPDDTADEFDRLLNEARPLNLSKAKIWRNINRMENILAEHMTDAQIETAFPDILRRAQAEKLPGVETFAQEWKTLQDTHPDKTPIRGFLRDCHRRLLASFHDHLVQGREARSVRTHVATRIGLVAVVYLAVVIAVTLLPRWQLLPGAAYPYYWFVVVALYGGLGSFASRLASFLKLEGGLRFEQLQSIYNFPNMFMRMTFGAFCAFILYWLVQSGVLGFITLPAMDVLTASLPAAEMSKILAASIIAGFSDSFVPNSISKD
jgi:hypothetical protein